LTTDIYGNLLHQRLTIFAKEEDLGGMLDGNPVAGKISGTHLHFIATDKRSNRTEVDARLDGDKLNGEMSVTLSNAPEEHVKHTFSGYALEDRPAGPPRNVEFKPTRFYNRFSAEITLF
jgi:amidase